MITRFDSFIGKAFGTAMGALGAATILLSSTVLIFSTVGHALPFNQDMSYGQNMPAGSVMRPRVPNTVPVGSVANYVASREEALTWSNPRAGNPLAIRNGERLFAVNCSPCHGKFSIDGTKLNYKPGAVSSQVPGPDLTDPTIAAKPDGHFFGYIYFGGVALMPAYGWKLSKTENWDIVSYVRKVQSVRAKGK